MTIHKKLSYPWDDHKQLSDISLQGFTFLYLGSIDRQRDNDHEIIEILVLYTV